MEPVNRVDDLEIDQDLTQQKKEWWIEKAGWMFMLVFLAAVCLGFFGGNWGLILRAVIVYVVLFILTRLSGKHTLAETTPFDFVVLLIISETTQQAMVQDDKTMTGAIILMTTLIGTTILLSLIQTKFPSVKKWIDGTPLIVLKDGKLIRDHAKKSRIDEYEILEAARRTQGLERLEQIKYAILEKDGEITIVKREKS